MLLVLTLLLLTFVFEVTRDPMIRGLYWAWMFLMQPVTPPLIVLAGLGIAILALVSYHWRGRRETKAPAGFGEQKVALGCWVDFGEVSYKVKLGNQFGETVFYAEAPCCSKCHAPATTHGGTYSRDYQCNNEACRALIKLSDFNESLKKRAEDTIEGAWNRVLLAGKRPYLILRLFMAEQETSNQ